MNSPNGRILIADDEEGIREILCRVLQSEGYAPLVAHDGEQALALIQRSSPDVLLLDIKMPGVDGMEVLRRAKKIDADLPVVMISSNGLVQDAVAALRAGAQDYLVKPFEHADVIRSVHSAMANRRLGRAVRILSDRTREAAHLRDIMGSSEAVSCISADVARVACSDFTVLVTGETGTGKELVARAIHQASARAAGAFVAVDCGAIPETLFESELFGHEKGAFTGAERSKAGRFEIATGGTLFLDEVSNMPVGCQAKLLRALQERTVYRVGSTTPVNIDARLLAAANEDLEGAVARGALRQDLFFRLNEFHIHIPPLRERKEDIIFLAHQFLDLTNRELQKHVAGISDPAMEQLLAYDWPGNVRQLRSTIRRAVLLAETMIEPSDLGIRKPMTPLADLALPRGDTDETVSLKELVRTATVSVERAALINTLSKTGGNKAKAARLLHIDYKTMHLKLKEYGIGTRAGGREGHEDR
jgi:DNA-binding NtrC family response regulator